jgi:hypothetical protein
MAQYPTFSAFGNNLVVKKSAFKTSGIFSDANHLFNIWGEDISRTYLGVIDVWNQMQLISTPLIKMTELQKNVIYVNGDDGEFTFSMPYKLEGVRVMEDITDVTNIKPGIDGQTFDVLLGDGSNMPTFQKGDTITYDFRDGQNLFIREVGDQLGEGFVYTVELVAVDKKNSWFDKYYLSPGTQFFKVSNRIDEFSEQFSGIVEESGMMKLLHKLGSWRGVEYTITGSASRLKLPKNIDFEKRYNSMMSPQSEEFALVFGKNDGKGGIEKGTLTWASMVEIMIAKEYLRMEENELMWAQPGEVMGARGMKMFINGGLYDQMKKGNRYRIPRYSREAIMNAFGSLFYSRPDIAPKDRHFKVQGGRGAVNEYTRIFAEELQRTATQFGLMLDNKSLGIVSGDRMNLSAGFEVSKMYLPGTGWVEIEYNPAFDAQTSRKADEPLIGAYGRYSYTSAIFDVTDGESTNAATPSSSIEFMDGANKNANVFMVRNSGMPATKFTIINGRTSPYGLYSGKYGVASSATDGFRMIAEGQSSIWLKDPTRSVLVELDAIQNNYN